VVADSFVLRNRQLLVAANRQAVKKPTFSQFTNQNSFVFSILSVVLGCVFRLRICNSKYESCQRVLKIAVFCSILGKQGILVSNS
jgi:hypothetical protein